MHTLHVDKTNGDSIQKKKKKKVTSIIKRKKKKSPRQEKSHITIQTAVLTVQGNYLTFSVLH